MSRVLKIILAVVCLLIALIIVISTISVLITVQAPAGIAEMTGHFLGVLFFLGVGMFFLWAGYRLIKSVKRSTAGIAKKRMSRELRVVLAVACFVTATALLLSVIRSISRYSLLPDPNAPDVYNKATVIGFWVGGILMLTGAFFLVRTGVRLLRPTKEKIELLGEEF